MLSVALSSLSFNAPVSPITPSLPHDHRIHLISPPPLKELRTCVRQVSHVASRVAAPQMGLLNTLTLGLLGEKEQNFLEAKPYYDQSGVPVNTFKNKSPHTGKIVSVKRIVGAAATGETCDIIIDHGGKMPYWEGQSYGVIPPGENPKKPGKPNTVRLYSIASTRYGDNMKGKTTTLCVRRATYWCPELKADDPAKKGICSNYLCDASAGDEVKLTGPSGKVPRRPTQPPPPPRSPLLLTPLRRSQVMLIPEDKPDTDLIMVATGTGIAPYRSFIRRIFTEKTPFAKV